MAQKEITQDQVIELATKLNAPFLDTAELGYAGSFSIAQQVEIRAEELYKLTFQGLPVNFKAASPLYWAIQANDLPKVRCLLKRGADPFLETPEFDSVYGFCKSSNRHNFIKLLDLCRRPSSLHKLLLNKLTEDFS